MKKRICREVNFSVSNIHHTIVQKYENVNINSMYDVMSKLRCLENLFEVQFKEKVTSFSYSPTIE